MKHKIFKLSQWDEAMQWMEEQRSTPPGRHQFTATQSGTGVIRVADENGERIKVSFAGSLDKRTVHAHVKDVGFIGGWRYPHRAMPWTHLTESINRGILYPRLEQLPNKFRKEIR